MKVCADPASIEFTLCLMYVFAFRWRRSWIRASKNNFNVKLQIFQWK